MKECFRLTKGKRGYQTSAIQHHNIRFTAELLACKLMRKCRPYEVPALIVSIAANCAEGYIYNWAAYIAKEFLEDSRDVQEKGRTFHYSWLIILISLIGWKEPTEVQFIDVPPSMSGAARYASLWVSQDKASQQMTNTVFAFYTMSISYEIVKTPCLSNEIFS